MTQITNSLNMITLLKERLTEELKSELYRTLLKEELDRIKPLIEDRVKAVVAKISFEKIEGVRDILQIRDELHIKMKWDGIE